MAIPYQSHKNVDRHVNGETNNHRVPTTPPNDVALHNGDIIARRAADKKPIPVSELGAAFGSASAAQQAAHAAFWGINHTPLEDKDLGPRAVPVLSRTGVFEYPLLADATDIEDGDFIGPAAIDVGGGNFQCQDQAVVKVANINESIGRARVTVATPDPVSRIEVDVVSSLFRGGVQAIQ